MSSRPRRVAHRPPRGGDRGAVDASIEMLFGMVAVLFVLLLLFEAVAYWHARNVFDEAASEGARVAAAFDGDCVAGVAAARRVLDNTGGSWSHGSRIMCTDGLTVTITISGQTPGVLGGAGMQATVRESAPKER